MPPQMNLGGDFNLFDNQLLKLEGVLQGKIDNNGQLLLEGGIKNLASFPMPNAYVKITNEEVKIFTEFLGAGIEYLLSRENVLTLTGIVDLGFDIHPTINPPDINGPGNTKISLPSFQVDLDISSQVRVQLSGIKPNILIKASFNGFSLEFNTDIILNSLNDLKDLIIAKIKENPLKYFCEIICGLAVEKLSDLLGSLNDKVDALKDEIDGLENNLQQFADNYDDIPGVGYLVQGVEIIGEAAFAATQEALDLLNKALSQLEDVLNQIAEVQALITQWSNRC